MRKEELKFAQRVVRKGYIQGAQILSCIELVQASNGHENWTLPELLTKQGYLTAQQAREINDELEKERAETVSAVATGGQKIGNYELIAQIGEGGMGVVYKARHTSNGRVVALKVLDPQLAKDQEFITRFLREARNVAKLKQHDNIVEGYDFGESNGKYYFAMEFVDGRSLAEILYGKGKVEEKTALHITRQVAKALQQAHRFSIIHRDIKPENIMISKAGVVKLCDLGLAKDLSEDFCKWGGVTVGTVYYASPEQSSGFKELVDIRSDIYSLGICLYHMLTGEPPFNDSNIRQVAQSHIHENLPAVTDKNPQVSPAAVHLLAKMTAKKISDRHQTPEEVIEEVETILQGRNTPDPALFAREKTPPKEPLGPSPVLKKRHIAPQVPWRKYMVWASGVLLLVAMAFLTRWVLK